MLNIYKTDDKQKIKKLNKIMQNTWIDLVNPTSDEIEEVVNKTNISKNLILKMLDSEELPRIETEDSSTLIVIDVPFIKDKKSKNKYTTLPIGIITNKNYLITISLTETEALNEFKNNKIKDLFNEKKTRFIIQLLFKIESLYIK